MKVRQLAEILSGEDQDMEVGFEHPSHDYWRSVLITEVDNVEVGYAKYSDYHQQLGAASEEEIEEAYYLEHHPDESVPGSKRVTQMLILK